MMFKKLFARKQQQQIQANIIPRSEHKFSRKLVSRNALTVLYRLHEAGFQAYLVGGCVRDILLGMKPKDFDVATDAKPEEIRKLFRNCRLIGRRFRLAHIYFGRDIIEVATFREEPNKRKHKKHQSESGRILRDNVYGDITSDALRRDFTINALYYNIADFSIVDYCNGVKDIEDHKLRLIGEPNTRYREDPVRILRAVRFCAKLDFDLADETAKPIKSSLKLLRDVPTSRIYEECLKLFLTGHGVATIDTIRDFDIHDVIIPPSKYYSEQEWDLIYAGLDRTDERFYNKKTVSPGFLFALLLWPAYQHQYKTKRKHDAMDAVFSDAKKMLTIPKRFSLITRSIWELQDRLINVKKHQVFRLLSHPSFRLAYDFLMLRAELDSKLNETCNWWQNFQAVDKTKQEEMLLQLPKGKKPRRRKKKVQQNEDA